MDYRKRILVGGGVRSGKSAFALTLARRLGTRRVFVATAQAFDAEMHERIVRHREERGPDFRTIEEPVSLVEVLAAQETDVVVVDCLTLWISNLLLRGDDEDAIYKEVSRLSDLRAPYHLILVTNEVGMGVVPESSLGRQFRDLAGFAHQRLASVSDEVYFGAMGMMLRIKPSAWSVSIDG